MKKFGARLLLILFSMSFALVLGEVGLRMIGFRQPMILPLSVRETYAKDPHATFLYRGYLPGTFEDFENVVTLNQFGFHDRDYEMNRPTPDTFRVMVLGDSYVASLSCPLEDIFHKQIETRLRKENPLNRGGYEVIAFGVGHKSQQAELEWLQEFGPVYRPDIVLLVFFCGNDVMENSRSLEAKAQVFGERYMKEMLPRKQALFDRLMIFPHSRVNGAFAEALTTHYCENLYRVVPGMKEEDFISPEMGVYQHPLPGEWQDAFARTDVLLRTIRDECARQGATLLIGCLEGPQAVGDVSEHVLRDEHEKIDFGQPARWLIGWCGTNGVPLCDLSPSLIDAGENKVFWRHDGHLNVYGNHVVANPLYRFIIENAGKQQKEKQSP